jgi:hypothetical protein
MGIENLTEYLLKFLMTVAIDLADRVKWMTSQISEPARPFHYRSAKKN